MRDRVPGLLDRDLIVVTGKGGVGKSTVSAALGLAAAARGLRTIVAEVAGRQDVARALGGDAGPGEHELADNLAHVSVEPDGALSEYLHEQLPFGPLAGLLTHSQVFMLFAAATPGMRELLTIGKVRQLARSEGRERPYDLVILDAPATGHGVALLTAPRTFARAARAGPVAAQAAEIDALLRDPRRTAVVGVATAEELAVSELIGLRASLRQELGRDVDRFVVNAVLPERFRAAERSALEAGAGDPAIRSALWMLHAARAQRAQLARLRRTSGDVRCTTLPLIFTPEPVRADLERLARILERPR